MPLCGNFHWHRQTCCRFPHVMRMIGQTVPSSMETMASNSKLMVTTLLWSTFVIIIENILWAVNEKAYTCLLLKLNQIGSILESMTTVNMAKQAGWGGIASHRSGKTKDTNIAEFAVGLCTGQIKTGAQCRSEYQCHLYSGILLLVSNWDWLWTFDWAILLLVHSNSTHTVQVNFHSMEFSCVDGLFNHLENSMEFPILG